MSKRWSFKLNALVIEKVTGDTLMIHQRTINRFSERVYWLKTLKGTPLHCPARAYELKHAK